jgi:hypothetical protein
MDDWRFDRLTKRLASACTRRQMLKGLLGLGAVGAGAELVSNRTDAARRGFSGPPFPTHPANPGEVVTPPPPTMTENQCVQMGYRGTCDSERSCEVTCGPRLAGTCFQLDNSGVGCCLCTVID